MATYAIGDIQGCFEPFMALLNAVEFNAKKDSLWLLGDLINRGPQSLETLRFVKGLKERAICVLGNHDFTLLAVGFGAIPYRSDKHNFEDILKAKDKAALLDWLRHCPLLHQDKNLGYVMVHAGLYPFWSLELARALAKEVETVLQGKEVVSLLKAQYGNHPDTWEAKLTGFDRLRFIINCCTRMRFCSMEGRLEFDITNRVEPAPAGYLPWFTIPNPLPDNQKLLFGHWASLEGKCPVENIFALDTGCVWGKRLTALRLEDGQRFEVACPTLGLPLISDQ